MAAVPENTTGKFIAVYSRYHSGYEEEFDSAKEAALFLLNGERWGELSWEKITDPDGVVIADSVGTIYKPLEALAGEDFFA